MGFNEDFGAFLDEDRKTTLGTALYSAADVNADQESGLHKIAKRTGVPVEALRLDNGAEALRREAAGRAETLIADAPKTAAFAADGHASLLADDLDNLSAVEKLVRAFRGGRQQQEQGRLAHKDMTAGLTYDERERMEGLGLLSGNAERMAGKARDFGVLSAGQIVGQMSESAIDSLDMALAAGMSAGGVAAWMGQAGPQAALPEEIITVPAATATAFGTALSYGILEDTRKVEAGHAYQEMKQFLGKNGETLDEETAMIAAQTVGVVNATIEALGLKIITAPYRKALKKAITAKATEGVTQLTAKRAAGRFAVAYGTQVAAETGQEIAQETVNVLAEEMAKLASEGEFDTATPEEVASRLWEIASKTAQGMAWLGLPGAGVSLNNDLRGARTAQKNQQFMEALGDTAKASKLRERLPEKFRELVAKIKEGGPVENIYVPAEQWKTFWQEKGIDPAEMAQDFNYTEALALGSDVIIPLEEYATRFAATEHHAELMRDVRLREDQMTSREAEEFRTTAAERFGSLVDEVESPDSSRKVYDDVLGGLIGIGRERSTAEREALLWQARYKTRAERLAVDAFELYQQAPLKITRPLPEVLLRGNIDTSIDPYLDALRSGELLLADNGPSLLEFMRERGIADDRGDLASMDVDKGRKPFSRKLLRKDGISLDAAGEMLWEAGYFTERPTTAEVLEAVNTELRGNPVYAPGRMDIEAEGKRQDLEQLQGYLQSMGVDLSAMDNEQVRQTLEQGRVMYQGGQPTTVDPATGLTRDRGEEVDVFVDRRNQALRDMLVEDMTPEQMKRALLTNELTGIPNRRAYADDNKKAGGPLPVQVSIDADSLKWINDNMGHHAGDQLLQNVADALAEVATLFDIRVYHISGDEFIIQSTDLIEAQAARKAVDKILSGRIIEGHAPDGSVITMNGHTVTYGFNSEGNFKDADNQLKIEKQNAETAGTRAGRGEVPPTVEVRRDRGPGLRGSAATDFFADLKRRRGVPQADTGGESLASQNQLLPRDGRTHFQQETDRLSVLHSLSRENLIFASDKRASITFAEGSRLIQLFEKADLSSFLHESGHAWLEELKEDAARDNAPTQIREDWNTIADWLEIDPNQEIPVVAHETFARGIEAYIREGKAPSTDLAPVFQRFKAWLLRIYKSLDLNVTLTKDVRQVMNRLLATDEEIRQTEQMQIFAPLFATAIEAGMSETEFAAYRKIAEAAHEEATRDLQQKLMDELSREQKAWWKDERAKVRQTVEAEAKKNPVYQAFQVLTKGEDFEGNAVEGFKIAKADLVKMYGEPFVKRLPRAFQRVYTKKGGLHPDEVAEVFGFSSGDEMVQAMVNTSPMKQAVEAETDVRMRETYGDMMLDGSIADEALNSVHSDQRGKVLQAELRALRKKQREVSPFVKAAQKEQAETEKQGRKEIDAIPPLQAFRLFAAQMIGAKALGDVRPDLYLKAEQKAGRLAFEAATKKDYITAAEEKRKQLLNHFLFIEARAAREEAEKIVDYAKRLEKPASQSRIGKAGGDYLDQINGILERYEFKAVSRGTLEKRQSLLEWARQQEDMGLEAAIPQSVLDEIGRRNYKTLSIDELRAVRDAMKNIEHLAREVNYLRIEGEEIELAEAVRELSDSAEEHFDTKRLPIDQETRSWLDKQGEKISRLDASLLKAEQLIEWLDGGKVNGPWNRMIFEPLAKAQAREFDLTKEYTQKTAEIFREYGSKKGNVLLEKIYIPSLGESLTRQAILAAALNTGNASNYDKLLKGREWTPAVIEDILSRMDGTDWAFIQSVWDTIESLWPEIAAMEKRLSGVTPPKIEAREITNQYGTFNGGYFPVVYDPLYSAAGEKHADARADKLFDSNYVRATTEKGHTKARLEQAAYPILLNLGVIPQHLAQVIHDLTHREAIITGNRLLTKTKGTLNATAGPAYHRMLTQWLASVANDRNIDQTGNQFWTNFFTSLRINSTIVGMGLRVTTMFTQIAGLSQSLDIVKGRYLAKGLAQFTRHPFESRAWVNAKSGEMRHRSNALDRDIRDGVRKLMGKKGAVAWIQSKSFGGIALFDAIVSTPTWMGAYEQAKAEGLSEKEAVTSGDRAVRLSQGAGGAKDLAAVQRSNDLMKLFTMFYSYFSVLYNRLRNMGRLKGIGEIGFMDVAFKSFVMVMAPALISEILANRGPDDDEDPLEWAAREILFYPLGTIPVVRDMANVWKDGYSYTLTPLSRALEMTTRLPGQIEQTIEGEKDVDDLVFQAFDLPGYLFGLPTGQVKNTTRYIWDVWNGDIQPEDGADVAKGLLFGERRK